MPSEDARVSADLAPQICDFFPFQVTFSDKRDAWQFGAGKKKQPRQHESSSRKYKQQAKASLRSETFFEPVSLFCRCRVAGVPEASNWQRVHAVSGSCRYAAATPRPDLWLPLTRLPPPPLPRSIPPHPTDSHLHLLPPSTLSPHRLWSRQGKFFPSSGPLCAMMSLPRRHRQTVSRYEHNAPGT